MSIDDVFARYAKIDREGYIRLGREGFKLSQLTDQEIDELREGAEIKIAEYYRNHPDCLEV